jgi:hypothetical protein
MEPGMLAAPPEPIRTSSYSPQKASLADKACIPLQQSTVVFGIVLYKSKNELLFSIVDSALSYVGHGRLGFINPSLYELIFKEENGILFNQILDVNDVIDGTNGNALLLGIPGFFAGPGYDNCSGWGSMKGQRLASNMLIVSPILSPGQRRQHPAYE